MTVEELTTIVWIVFLGICCGAFYAFYQKKILGDLVRSILRAEAYTEDSAKTLAELGYGDGARRWAASWALREGTGLRRTVYAVYPEEKTKKVHEDELFCRRETPAQEQRYYIPEEQKYTADTRYDDEGTTVTTLLFTAAAFFAAALVIIAFLPRFTAWYNGLSSDKGLSSGAPDNGTSAGSAVTSTLNETDER